MAFKGIVAAAFVAALMAGGSAQADNSGCRKQCDARFNSCSKSSKSDACLRTWHSCKKTCTAPAVAAAKPRAATQTPAPQLAQVRR